MEDDLKFFQNWKTTLIFSKLEDDLNFSKMEDNYTIFKIEDDLIFKINGRRFKMAKKQTKNHYQMDSN